jgi:carboxymethylenebutenolidase
MDAKWLTIPLRGEDVMEAYHVIPQADNLAPQLVLLQEIFGVNEAMRHVAHEYAREGFEVLVPDLFWRAERRIALDYTPDGRARAEILMQDFDAELGFADIMAALAWFRRVDGRVGAVGFCLGGKLATLLGARGAVDCGVSFYGVQLAAHIKEIANAKSRLLLHFGELDTQIPLALVGEIEARSDLNENVEVHIHAGAQHGFFNSMRPERYHAKAAARANARSLMVLREYLGRSAV